MKNAWKIVRNEAPDSKNEKESNKRKQANRINHLFCSFIIRSYSFAFNSMIVMSRS